MNTPYPKISVITPSFNQAEFLERTILSVINQNYPNLEYIIIDGGSSDGSVDIIKKYADRLAYFVSEPDGGQANAINKGFNKATGEWIAWQNSDDIFYPDAFISLATNTVNHPNAEVITGNINIIDRDDKILHDIRYVKPTYYGMLAEGMILTNQAAFWRRHLHEEIGLIDESMHYAFDYDWFLRLIRGRECVHVDSLWGGYRLHDATKTHNHAQGFQDENELILSSHPALPIWVQQAYRFRRMFLLLVNRNYLYVLRGIYSRIIRRGRKFDV